MGYGSSRISAVLGGILLIASGCQSTPTLSSNGIDNARFMSLWNTYTHCSAAEDITITGTDVQRLTDAARSQHEADSFVLPLPKELNRLITTPSSRYAVDVRAMASACSLHAGQLALDSGRLDLAREMFTSVLSLHTDAESSYYLTQARTQLSQIESGLALSFKTP